MKKYKKSKEEKIQKRKNHSIYEDCEIKEKKLPVFISTRNQYKERDKKLISYLKEKKIYYFRKELPRKTGLEIIRVLVKIKKLPKNYTLFSIGNDLQEYSVENPKLIINKLEYIQKRYIVHLIVKHGKHIRCIISPKYNKIQEKLIRYIEEKYKEKTEEEKNKIIYIYLREYNYQKEKIKLIKTYQNNEKEEYEKFIKRYQYQNKEISEEQEECIYKKVIKIIEEDKITK